VQAAEAVLAEPRLRSAISSTRASTNATTAYGLRSADEGAAATDTGLLSGLTVDTGPELADRLPVS
jgi:alanine dehydrogenase